jgi:hypothetical protein
MQNPNELQAYNKQQEIDEASFLGPHFCGFQNPNTQCKLHRAVNAATLSKLESSSPNKSQRYAVETTLSHWNLWGK